MIRRALFLAGLFVTSSAFASWNPSFNTTYVPLVVGRTTTVTLSARWSGLVDYGFTPWVCGSDNPGVARVEGGLATLKGSGEVKITAIAPGTAYVRFVAPNGNLFSVRFVTIVVRPEPVTVRIAPSAWTVTAGQPLTLIALSQAVSQTMSLSFTWYSGHTGDRSHPLQGTGNEITVVPPVAGRYYFWVSATAPDGLVTSEVLIDVQPAPRRRAVGPR
jgi:hypothetical protein